MPIKSARHFAALLLAFWAFVACAEDKGPPKAIEATNSHGLRALIGKQGVVTGKVAKANVSGSGMHFLNFEGDALKAVTPRDSVGQFPGGGPAKLYAGKSVEISGLVEAYKGAPQIRLLAPSQIKVLEASPPVVAKSPEPRAYSGKLKSTGRNEWLSPVGLRYAGRDPEGLNRVEHVMRHGQDIPHRPGSHGVFEGDQEAIFALIDEAWDKAQSSGLRALNEGGRSSYTVPMGRRVGYLGGQEGARRRHPPLKRVFMVFETGTKNMVTAFPK